MTSLSTNDANVVSPAIVLEAIVKQQAIAGVYNRMDVTLAPHILYTRHGDLHIAALTLERDGRPPKEAKIGTFKLAGLRSVRLTPRRFQASELFDARDAKYADVALMAVDKEGTAPA